MTTKQKTEAKIPLPLEIDGFDLTIIITKHPSGTGWLKVCDCDGEFTLEENKAHAHYIQRAVNSHDKLVEALKECQQWIADESSGEADILDYIKGVLKCEN